MPGRVAHVAFNTDDEDATRAFYEGLFEWRFEPYYPGFVRTVLPPAAEFVAAVQTRRELLPGRPHQRSGGDRRGGPPG